MDKKEELQTKKLKNRIVDQIRKVNIITLIKLAKILGIPIQTDLMSKYDEK